MSFDTLLSEFVVVLCNTRSMLVKARWASPIHYLAAVRLFRAFLAFWARYFSRAAAQHCELVLDTTLRDQ